MKLQHFWFLSLFLLLLACKDTKNGSEKTANPEAKGTTNMAGELEGIWTLKKLNKETIKNKTSYKNPTMEITPSEGKITGNSGCNKYNGSIRLGEGKQINIELVETTKVPCPRADLEGKYLKAIKGENLTYEINGNEMIFSNEETTLVFEKAD